jgi:hypothetical protein
MMYQYDGWTLDLPQEPNALAALTITCIKNIYGTIPLIFASSISYKVPFDVASRV